MILCTHYGLLVFDFSISSVPKFDEKKEEATTGEREINLVIKYKISVLPDEQVIDCVILDPKRPKES